MTPAVAPIPELYVRWRDPETGRVVRMERVVGDSEDAAFRTTRVAVTEHVRSLLGSGP